MECRPYLFFDGNCEEALNFYAELFKGKIAQMTRVKDGPSEYQGDPTRASNVMHSQFESPSVSFNASDASGSTKYGEGRISLCLETAELAEAERIWKGLTAGAKVEMPFGDTFWGAKFGMLTDRFGIDWMVNCQMRPQ